MSKSYTTVNPATGQSLQTFETINRTQIETIINNSHNAQQKWAKTSIDERIVKLNQLAYQLRQRKEEAAKLMAQEMGKPVSQGQNEIEKCISNCHYYARNLHDYLAPEKIDLPDLEAYRYFEPLGLIYAIMPWNFPVWQVLRCAVPNLAAGNGIILKHAENVIASAKLIEQMIQDAGFEPDLFKSVVIDLADSDYIIEHQHIQGVTLTGSNKAGKQVGQKAGQACKKVVMELGGSDPYLILNDADIAYAAQTCTQARLLNAGQVCVSPKRIIVNRSIKSQFEKHILENAQTFSMDDPQRSEAKMGPMARKDLKDDLHKQIQSSIEKGAKCLLGGYKPDETSSYYPATVLTDVGPGMPAFDEEMFGPVIAIIASDSESEAIDLANQSPFGLGGAVFTSDIEKGLHIASKEIHSGMCNVNKHVTSDPRIPFGGIKQSGFGREIAKEGIREFVNIKSVIVDRDH